jgi:hypothetical protein
VSARLAAACALLAGLLAGALGAPHARAQTGGTAQAAAASADSTATADSAATAAAAAELTLPGEPVSQPFLWVFNYNQDRATGTWTQTLAYGLHSGRVTFDINGNLANVTDILQVGVGGQNGDVNGMLGVRLGPRWNLAAVGRFSSDKFGQPVSGTDQRTDRLQLRTDYAATPFPDLTLSVLLSTEFQQDRSISFRPVGNTIVTREGITPKIGWVKYDHPGQTPPPDAYQVYATRDSSVMNGRLDGANVQLDWKPGRWVNAMLLANGSMSRPVTKTVKTEHLHAPARDGQTDHQTVERYESPIDNSLLQGRVGLPGFRPVQATLNLRRVETQEEYYDRLIRKQERSYLNQRSASLQAVSRPVPGLEVTATGTLSRTLKLFRIRESSNSLVTSRDFDLFGSFVRPETRGSLRLQLGRARNERQEIETQNGSILQRFFTAAAARRVSARLWLDGMASASLFSYRYFYPPGTTPLANDIDNARASFNVGGGYRVSDRCSTTVHFSTDRNHRVSIGAASASNNSVQTNYQMNATFALRPTRRLLIEQVYQLSAVYQIYDYTESRNVLNRTRRIDTTVTDSLLPFLGIGLTHNFLYLDQGPYTPETPGGPRLFNVASESYHQNLAVKLGLRPARGAFAFAQQNLANRREYILATKTETVANRWTLTLGGELRRELPGSASFEASVQHIGEFNERPPDCGACTNFFENRLDYWLITATFQKAF